MVRREASASADVNLAASDSPGNALGSNNQANNLGAQGSDTGLGTNSGAESPVSGAPLATGNVANAQEHPAGSPLGSTPVATGSDATNAQAATGLPASGSTMKFDQTPACDGEARKSDQFRYAGYWYQ